MRLASRVSREVTIGRLAGLGMVCLSIVACRCAIPEARGASQPPVPDGGGARANIREQAGGPSAPAAGSKFEQADGGQALHPATSPTGPGVTREPDDTPAASEPSDSLVGLTRAQVKQKRGRPTVERENEWVYTPDQPGCRETIVSEVITFKQNVVASVHLTRSRTHKVCRGDGRRP